MRDPLTLLHEVFGFPGFRGVQEAVVARVMRGAGTLAVMPTGAGKSLCYQLPALARPGTAVIVSPLIALMHDQVRSAEAFGIRAAALTSADEDRAETMRRFRDGQLDLLYVAPERASGESFRSLLRATSLALFAIDEAHCVSEWGHDFRPDYRLLRPLLDAFPEVPRLALTATADRHTRADILEQLGLPQDGLIVAGFDRPNIRYMISPRDGLQGQLKTVLANQAGAGIVYAPTRDATERIAAQLAAGGRTVRAYHAGMDPGVRRRNQQDFVASEDMVMVATVAFGMGIDKPDVRFVAHAGLPKSIEGYYQETGRAGRDGEPAIAHLFWGAEDFARARKRLSEVDEARASGERARLSALAGLVETSECRRMVLLRYFGEDPRAPCGNCDNCLAPPATVDATEVARKLLSAAFRTEMRFGVGHLLDVLAGRETDKVIGNGHHRLSVFGIADEAEQKLVRPVARALLARDALRADDYGGLSFGPAARPILKGEHSLAVALPAPKARRRRGGAGEESHAHDPLFEALRARRREIAQARGVPPYVIFHDSTLREMAGLHPTTLEGLAQVTGVGQAKREAYGDAFLEVLRGWRG
ncbi:DNA helicase RecQ [Sphingomonas morindae]|uniref:DNA helicase RecQ n=1 Tax=Sphingomonas morindae TaxID=1541170 RepID=A0ABY4XBZ7_9SPHN|nr:DNA helicase RecQ [Sphingomonas morindae]USI74231.1 DNA helicase RecQ [Sphingomonas morindae]